MSNNQNNINFRIVFVTPFFELEVRNGGQHWQVARSQVAQQSLPAPDDESKGRPKYQRLQFTSYPDAEAYARTVLGLRHEHRSILGWLFASPAMSQDAPSLEPGYVQKSAATRTSPLCWTRRQGPAVA